MSANANWRRLYPFRSHRFSINGLSYHYLDEGQGPPLLLVHGNPTWSFYWRNLVLGLRDQFRLIVPDHIGCGLSDKPSAYDYTLARHTENLTKLVEHLDLSDVTLLAHDWGGAIGLGAALAQPARFERFVLFNTGAFPPWFIPWRIRACRLPLFGRVAVQGMNLFARAALRMAIKKPGRMTPEVRAGLLAPYDCWASRIAIYRFVRDIPSSPRHPTYQTLVELEQGLPALADRPFLFVWGMHDWCFRPECLEKFLQILPDAEVDRIPDAGHYVIEDAYEHILPRVKQFITQHATPPGERAAPDSNTSVLP